MKCRASLPCFLPPLPPALPPLPTQLAAPPCDAQLALLGQLMLQSHVSYSGVGLGSQNTDLLVSLVEELGPARGLFGAKITGGGSGGTVCVLGAGDAEAAVQEARARAPAPHTAPMALLLSPAFRPRSSNRLLATLLTQTQVLKKYTEKTGVVPYVFRGSSPGAAEFGAKRVRIPA